MKNTSIDCVAIFIQSSFDIMEQTREPGERIDGTEKNIGRRNINKRLFGFANGVYDLEEKKFRKICPDDVIDMKVEYDYVEYDKKDDCDDINLDKIKNFLKDSHDDLSLYNIMNLLRDILVVPSDKLEDLYNYNENITSAGSFFQKYIGNLIIKKYKTKEYSEETKSADEEKIYSDDNVTLVCSRIYGLSKVIAIPDQMNANRFLITVSYMNTHSYMCEVGGIIAYFDNENQLQSKIIINRLIGTYDDRNGRISIKNTFFRNQFLVIVMCHRDNRKVILEITEFNYDDTCIHQTTIYTDIKCDRYSHDTTIHLNKLIHVAPKIYLDMSSIKFHTEKKELSIDKYNTNTLEEFLATFDGKNYDEQFNDGYPLKCIKCNNKLSRITAYYMYCITQCGSGVCESCLIRFSKTEGRWKCCQMVQNGTNTNYVDCYGNLNGDNQCTNDHASCIFEFTTSVSTKFPFKNEGSLVIRKK